MTLDEAFARLKTTDNQDAWHRFYVEATQPLLAYVSSLLVSFRLEPGESAQDVVHEVMVAFLDRWPKLKSQLHNAGSAMAYLKKSCRNLLVDQYRHSKSAEVLLTFLSSRYSESLGTHGNILRPILLNQIIGKLQPECSALLLAYVSDDLTPAEIAEREGIAAGTLYSRWYRCLQKARSVLHSKDARS